VGGVGVGGVGVGAGVTGVPPELGTAGALGADGAGALGTGVGGIGVGGGGGHPTKVIPYSTEGKLNSHILNSLAKLLSIVLALASRLFI
jgi:hypothetical protein